ncbi:hypothetical protein B0H14DRAFT_2558051 [Mycena olivaceomarginata]|nr:hypothetical protein B0H14DRAFT_2558051 [Mycena olivaceomarginata]
MTRAMETSEARTVENNVQTRTNKHASHGADQVIARTCGTTVDGERRAGVRLGTRMGADYLKLPDRTRSPFRVHRWPTNYLRVLPRLCQALPAGFRFSTSVILVFAVELKCRNVFSGVKDVGLIFFQSCRRCHWPPIILTKLWSKIRSYILQLNPRRLSSPHLNTEGFGSTVVLKNDAVTGLPTATGHIPELYSQLVVESSTFVFAPPERRIRTKRRISDTERDDLGSTVVLKDAVTGCVHLCPPPRDARQNYARMASTLTGTCIPLSWDKPWFPRCILSACFSLRIAGLAT